MVNYALLSANWIKWMSLAGIKDVKVSSACADCQIVFKSGDQSFHLQHGDDWWKIDEVDDRGRRYDSTARLSTFELAEKYLIWNWASVARSAIGATQLGVRLHAIGLSQGVEIAPTAQEYFVELRATTGSAIVSQAIASIFSQLMLLTVEDVDRLVSEGLK